MKTLTKSFVNPSTGLFILRIVLGVTFFAHGSQKLFGWFGGYGLEATLGFFSNGGIPVVLGIAAIAAEFLGGLGLIFGLLTRISALGIMIVMLVAIFKVHLVNGFFAPSGVEFPLALFTIALAIFLVGPDKYTIDNKLFSQESVNKS